MLTTIAGGLLTAAALLGVNAGAPDATQNPQVHNPVTPQVQVQAPPHAWGVRAAAREADLQIEGVTISTKGECTKGSPAWCVRVQVRDFGDSGWYAQTWSPRHGRTRIQFNTHYDHHNRPAVAAHEFAHALGLGHHLRHGVCGRFPDERHFSPSELRALRRAY